MEEMDVVILHILTLDKERNIWLVFSKGDAIRNITFKRDVVEA
jgi:hypothetical protein